MKNNWLMIEKIIKKKCTSEGTIIMCKLKNTVNMIVILVLDSDENLIDSVSNCYTESCKKDIMKVANKEYNKRKDMLMKHNYIV